MMTGNGYFHQVLRETPTLPWINTAVESELEAAIKWGAVGNTMNPTHPPKAIKTDRHIWQPVIDDLLRREPSISDDDAADFVTRLVAERSAKMLFPAYEESGGKYGYAAIQSDPNTNDDLQTLIECAVSYSKIAANVVPKAPSTEVGAQAVEELTVKGINTIATMGFSVAQAVAMAEAYERGLKRSDAVPRHFVVVIPGVFHEYLGQLAQSKGIDVSSDVLSCAGLVVGRLVYRIFRERGYKADILIGGTRDASDVTGFVGGSLHITHSFGTWAQLTEESPPVISRISEQVPPEVVSELELKFEDFRKACRVDGLSPGEFRGFGPCVKFHNDCLKGYSGTIAEIRAARERIQGESSIFRDSQSGSRI